MPISRTGVGRRETLRALGVGVAAPLSGCSAVAGGIGSVGRDAVSLLAAGSLQAPLLNGLQPAMSVPLRIEAHGSATIARLVAGGHRDPDIVALADTALFESVLTPRWYRTFATNALVVAVNTATPGGRAVRDADRWYRPVADGRATLGRTDPDQDPLGYRTLFMLRLAADRYGRPTLPSDVLRPDQIYPETELMSYFETGSIDAAVVYRSMAVAHDYDFVDLPPTLDLGHPAHADAYAEQSYELPSGTVVRGGVVAYGATAYETGSDAVAAFRGLTTGDYLREFGFEQSTGYPRDTGDVPTAYE